MATRLRRAKRPGIKRKTTTGVRSLVIGGFLFALGGVMAIWKPVSFYLIGGSRGQWKDAALSGNGSQGFGWFFLALSVFLFASAWRLKRR